MNIYFDRDEIEFLYHQLIYYDTAISCSKFSFAGSNLIPY